MDSTVAVATAGRFVAPLDRAYHPEDHTWILREGGLVRVGIDSLGLETIGDLAQMLLVPVGTVVQPGDELGTIEAQKFVGPLRAPLAGTVLDVNERVLENPLLVSSDCYGEGWLVVIQPGDEASFDSFVQGEAIGPWFAESLKTYIAQGSVAE